MPIIEDNVKTALKKFLEERGFSSVKVQLGTRPGYDVAGINPTTGKLLVIECKGEAQAGNQHSRSWQNVAFAILTSLNETENLGNLHEVGMAFPDTKEYRERMKSLRPFCKRQNITVYWVSADGAIQQW